jgi:hypothetical protein
LLWQLTEKIKTMTDRERWTVYPLLFLTLGIAVKDKIAGRSTADTVLCETLVVHDRKGKEQVVISSTPVGGQMLTLGDKNALGVLLGHTEKMAGLMFVDSRGRLIRSMASMPTGVAPAGAVRPGRGMQEAPRESPSHEHPAPPGEHPPEEQPPEQPDEPMPEQ